MDHVIALIAAWCFERAQLIISAPNYNSPFNGFGAIDLVLQGRSKQPMQYRVFLPWLVAFFETFKIQRIGIYEGLKVLMIMGAFWGISLVFGLPAMLLAALLLLLTIKYDYWDWAPEIFGVCMALTGDLRLAVAGGVVHGLSKETAPLVPVAYYIATGDINAAGFVGAFTAFGMVLPRIIYGKKPMYCERIQIKYNLALFKAFSDKGFWKWGQFYFTEIWISCAITLLTIVAVIARGSWDGLIPLAILAAGWTMAKADEGRVFALAVPWIAAWVMAWN